MRPRRIRAYRRSIVLLRRTSSNASTIVLTAHRAGVAPRGKRGNVACAYAIPGHKTWVGRQGPGFPHMGIHASLRRLQLCSESVSAGSTRYLFLTDVPSDHYMLDRMTLRGLTPPSSTSMTSCYTSVSSSKLSRARLWQRNDTSWYDLVRFSLRRHSADAYV